jgi:hypothetical protein
LWRSKRGGWGGYQRRRWNRSRSWTSPFKTELLRKHNILLSTTFHFTLQYCVHQSFNTHILSFTSIFLLIPIKLKTNWKRIMFKIRRNWTKNAQMKMKKNWIL